MSQILVEVSGKRRLRIPDKDPVAGKGEGAAYGAKKGAGTVFVGGTYIGARLGCDPGWTAFWILTCPAGIAAGAAAGAVAAIPSAAVGAAIGSHKAQSEERVAKTTADFSRIMKDTNIREDLRRLVVSEIEEQTTTVVVDLNAMGATRSAMTLTLIVEQAAISMKGRLQPALYIEISTKAKLRKPYRVASVYERSWQYYAEIGDYFQLMERDGAALRRAIDVSLERMATEIVIDLFLSDEPERLAPGERSVENRVVTTGGPLLKP